MYKVSLHLSMLPKRFYVCAVTFVTFLGYLDVLRFLLNEQNLHSANLVKTHYFLLNEQIVFSASLVKM